MERENLRRRTIAIIFCGNKVCLLSVRSVHHLSNLAMRTRGAWHIRSSTPPTHGRVSEQREIQMQTTQDYPQTLSLKRIAITIREVEL